MSADLDTQRQTVETVVKVGGAVYSEPASLEPVARALASASGARRILVVPGGGTFADRVRDVDRRFGLSDSAAHWMAILAMDQAALFLAEKIPRGMIVTEMNAVRGVIGQGRVPVLAPWGCLVDADPLPHSWEVTSDSIAAWVAGRLGAWKLVLVKPPGVDRCSSSTFERIPDCVDGYFGRALPRGIEWTIVPADDESLASVLEGLSPS